jgi:hypothetical protein
MIEISSKTIKYLPIYQSFLNPISIYKEVFCLKIAFWSNAKEKCNVSANLAAISVASVMRYPYSVIVVENQLSHNNLGKAFMGDDQVSLFNEVGTNYYDGGGIEGLLRKIYRENYSSDILKFYLKEIIDHHLYYIPQSRVIHSELFDYEFNHCIHPLFQMIEEAADICLIDTASHQNLSTKTILEEADLIVVNLCQNPDILEDFMLNYSSLISKSVFIISKFDSHSILNSKRIAGRYQLPWENILLIPNNTSYQNAYESGSVIEFIHANYYCLKGHPNYIFIQSIRKAAYIIMKKAEQAVKEREISLCGR